MDANEFLNSKGLLYTRELININDERINIIELLNEYKALSQHDVSGQSEQLIDFAVKEGYFEGVPKGNLMGLIDRFEKSINCH